MALPVVLDCHSSLLVGGGGSGGNSRPSVSGSVVLGRLFAHLPSLIADVNVGKLKAVKEKPNLLETDKVTTDTARKTMHRKGGQLPVCERYAARSLIINCSFGVFLCHRGASSLCVRFCSHTSSVRRTASTASWSDSRQLIPSHPIPSQPTPACSALIHNKQYNLHIGGHHSPHSVCRPALLLHFLQTVIPPHSSVPHHHYPDLDSEADISDDDLRDPDIDNENDDSDDNNRGQEEVEGGGGYYKGGKYRAFQVSKHSLYVRAIARYSEEGAEEERGKEGKEEKNEEVEDAREDEFEEEGRVNDKKGGKKEKEVIEEEEDEKEGAGVKRKRQKRSEKVKSDKKGGGRRHSVTVVEDDDFV